MRGSVVKRDDDVGLDKVAKTKEDPLKASTSNYETSNGVILEYAADVLATAFRNFGANKLDREAARAVCDGLNPGSDGLIDYAAILRSDGVPIATHSASSALRRCCNVDCAGAAARAFLNECGQSVCERTRSFETADKRHSSGHRKFSRLRRACCVRPRTD